MKYRTRAGYDHEDDDLAFRQVIWEETSRRGSLHRARCGKCGKVWGKRIGRCYECGFVLWPETHVSLNIPHPSHYYRRWYS